MRNSHEIQRFFACYTPAHDARPALRSHHLAGRHRGAAAARSRLDAVRLGEPAGDRQPRAPRAHAARGRCAVHRRGEHRSVAPRRQPAARRGDGRAAGLGRLRAALRQRARWRRRRFRGGCLVRGHRRHRLDAGRAAAPPRVATRRAHLHAGGVAGGLERRAHPVDGRAAAPRARRPPEPARDLRRRQRSWRRAHAGDADRAGADAP